MHLSLPRTASQLALGFILGASLVTGTLTARAVSAAEPPTGLSTVAPGTRMPAFELPGLDGNKVRATDLRNKVTVIRFWATW